MKMQVQESSLEFFEALASATRLKIIRLLSEGDLNIKELANMLGISSSIMSKHIKKLEKADIVMPRMVKKDGNLQKTCTLLNRTYELEMPIRFTNTRSCHIVSIPVGQYTDAVALPPCGIASVTEVIGGMDEPAALWCPERMKAGLLWMAEGYVEYTVPNLIQDKQQLEEIEISAEMSSEATGHNDDWPSDIQLTLNGKLICTVTTPGDFGERRGTLTPAWWNENQYGILYIIRISEHGVQMNGKHVPGPKISELNMLTDKWHLRFEVSKAHKQIGGQTFYGRTFGNYKQDIEFKMYYKAVEEAAKHKPNINLQKEV